jgi:hypothetical protein
MEDGGSVRSSQAHLGRSGSRPEKVLTQEGCARSPGARTLLP